MILSQKFYLRIFTGFSTSGVNFAYHSYEKPLRTAHSKKIFRHLTPIYIFLGPTPGALREALDRMKMPNTISWP